jgi:hypothetical protein
MRGKIVVSRGKVGDGIRVQAGAAGTGADFEDAQLGVTARRTAVSYAASPRMIILTYGLVN